MMTVFQNLGDLSQKNKGQKLIQKKQTKTKIINE